MTLEELDALYDRANRLVLGRSAAAAGKALVFSSSTLDDCAGEIADMYGLTDDERSALATGGLGKALATFQNTASGLLDAGTRIDAKRVVTIARTAIDGGRKVKAVAAFLKAGPTAAEAAAAGGQIAGKATIWGWVATAAYAAGTGSWFAYNLRSFNLAAYDARRIREGLEARPAGASVRDVAAAGLASVANVAASGAKAVGHGVGNTVTTAAKGGGWLVGAASGLFRRGAAEAVGPQPPENSKGSG